jgi:hypothetical protein
MGLDYRGGDRCAHSNKDLYFFQNVDCVICDCSYVMVCRVDIPIFNADLKQVITPIRFLIPLALRYLTTL